MSSILIIRNQNTRRTPLRTKINGKRQTTQIVTNVLSTPGKEGKELKNLRTQGVEVTFNHIYTLRVLELSPKIGHKKQLSLT